MIGPAAVGAHRELLEQLRPFVARRVTSPADVDDVLQDVFVRLHRGVGRLRSEDRFGPWVYSVARTAIADHRRSRRRHPLAGRSAPEEEAVAADALDPEPSAEELLAMYVAPLVAQLPSPYREALTLTELQGVSQVEAAAMLDLPPSTMKSRVQRGRARLRQLIDACCAIALDARGRVVGCEPRAVGDGACVCSAEGPSGARAR